MKPPTFELTYMGEEEPLRELTRAIAAAFPAAPPVLPATPAAAIVQQSTPGSHRFIVAIVYGVVLPEVVKKALENAEYA